MGRPQTKNEVIEAAINKYYKLQETIENLSIVESTTPFDFSMDVKKKEAHWARDKNLRDVLIHLYEWHQLAIRWISENRAGNKVAFLPAPYNWKTYGKMNIEFIQKHESTQLEDAKKMLEKSHTEIMEVIASFSNEELFTKGMYDWTGTTTVGSYLVSATSSHYDWALKKLRAHKKQISSK